jgi:uncharacterized membrane protein
VINQIGYEGSAHPPTKMTKLSGQSRFLVGVTLICLSRAVPALVILLYQGGFSWFFPVVGALLFITLSYCAWRGERWAYYLLMFLNIIGCILSLLVIVSPPKGASLALTIFLLAAAICGALLLSLSEDTQTFMGAQRRRFASDPRDYE